MKKKWACKDQRNSFREYLGSKEYEEAEKRRKKREKEIAERKYWRAVAKNKTLRIRGLGMFEAAEPSIALNPELVKVFEDLKSPEFIAYIRACNCVAKKFA